MVALGTAASEPENHTYSILLFFPHIQTLKQLQLQQ